MPCRNRCKSWGDCGGVVQLDGCVQRQRNERDRDGNASKPKGQCGGTRSVAGQGCPKISWSLTRAGIGAQACCGWASDMGTRGAPSGLTDARTSSPRTLPRLPTLGAALMKSFSTAFDGDGGTASSLPRSSFWGEAPAAAPLSTAAVSRAAGGSSASRDLRTGWRVAESTLNCADACCRHEPAEVCGLRAGASQVSTCLQLGLQPSPLSSNAEHRGAKGPPITG